MPVKIETLKTGKYRVRTPSQVHAKGTTKAKAKAQERLLNALDHGWKVPIPGARAGRRRAP